MLSKSQLIYLRMEAKGLTTLSIATRRQVAQTIERMPLSPEGVILIEFKSAREEVDTALHHLVGADREKLCFRQLKSA